MEFRAHLGRFELGSSSRIQRCITRRRTTRRSPGSQNTSATNMELYRHPMTRYTVFLSGLRHASPRTYVYVICIATSRRCSHHKGSSVASALSVKDNEIYSRVPMHQLHFWKVKEYRKMTKSKIRQSRKSVAGFSNGARL